MHVNLPTQEADKLDGGLKPAHTNSSRDPISRCRSLVKTPVPKKKKKKKKERKK
jgi:hypothetical protein